MCYNFQGSLFLPEDNIDLEEDGGKREREREILKLIANSRKQIYVRKSAYFYSQIKNYLKRPAIQNDSKILGCLLLQRQRIGRKENSCILSVGQ